jgi:hypothetical protein
MHLSWDGVDLLVADVGCFAGYSAAAMVAVFSFIWGSLSSFIGNR